MGAGLYANHPFSPRDVSGGRDGAAFAVAFEGGGSRAVDRSSVFPCHCCSTQSPLSISIGARPMSFVLHGVGTAVPDAAVSNEDGLRLARKMAGPMARDSGFLPAVFTGTGNRTR